MQGPRGTSCKKRLTEDEGMKETSEIEGDEKRETEGERGREREWEKEKGRESEGGGGGRGGGKGGREAATRAHVCATTSQADTDDGRPCLVTSPACLDGIYLFVRPFPAPFAD